MPNCGAISHATDASAAGDHEDVGQTPNPVKGQPMRTITARGGTDIFYKVGTVRVAKAVFLSVITPPMLKLNANADGLRIVPFNHQRRSPRRSVVRPYRDFLFPFQQCY